MGEARDTPRRPQHGAAEAAEAVPPHPAPASALPTAPSPPLPPQYSRCPGSAAGALLSLVAPNLLHRMKPWTPRAAAPDMNTPGGTRGSSKGTGWACRRDRGPRRRLPTSRACIRGTHSCTHRPRRRTCQHFSVSASGPSALQYAPSSICTCGRRGGAAGVRRRSAWARHGALHTALPVAAGSSLCLITPPHRSVPQPC